MTHYDPHRPADPLNAFWSYQDKSDSPEIIVDQFTGNHRPPSYLISTESEIGKTSFLLRLEWLLCNKIREGMSTPWIPLPVYISCKSSEVKDIALFCKYSLQRIMDLLSESGIISSHSLELVKNRYCKLHNNSTFSEIVDKDIIYKFQYELKYFIDILPDLNIRIIFLIDDIHSAFDKEWGAEIVELLRALFQSDRSYLLGKGRLALAFTMIPSIIDKDPYSPIARLRAIANKVIELRSFSFEETQQIITMSNNGACFDKYWIDIIYHQTGGHPRLLQYVMYRWSDMCDANISQFKKNFSYIFEDGFQSQSLLREFFIRLMCNLPELGPSLIIYLEARQVEAYHPILKRRNTNSSLEAHDILEVSEAEIKQAITKMINLGILYKTPSSDNIPYRVSGMFFHWFLKKTGGSLIWNMFDRKSQFEVSNPIVGKIRTDKPFMLFASGSIGAVISDGMHTAVHKMDNFVESCKYQIKMLKNINEYEDLLPWSQHSTNIFFQNSDTLKLELLNYLTLSKDLGLNSSLVFQVSTEEKDKPLLDFPIELTLVDNTFLGVRLPVYKELVCARQQPVYRIQKDYFNGLKNLNILLICSAIGGDYYRNSCDTRFPRLGYAYEEIEYIIRALLEHGKIGQYPIDTILCLTDDHNQLHIPENEHVKIREVKGKDFCETFRKVLREGFEGIEFHLFHYAGHYDFDSKEDGEIDSGFLFADGTKVTSMLNERELETCLRQTNIRMAYISACKTSQHRDYGQALIGGPSKMLIQSGVRVVIGMRWPIRDDEACILAKNYYEEFVKSGRPELALFKTRETVWNMRQEIKETIGRESICWAAPVMLT